MDITSQQVHGWNTLFTKYQQDIYQWFFLVPIKGGSTTTQKAIYKWYILPIGGLHSTGSPPFMGTKNNHWQKKPGFQRRCVFVWCVNSCKKPIVLRIFHEQIQGDSCFYSLGIAGYGPQQFHSRRRGSFVRAPGLTWESLATRPSPDLRTSGPNDMGIFFWRRPVVTRKKTPRCYSISF